MTTTQSPLPPPARTPARSRRSLAARRMDHNFLLLTRTLMFILVGYLLFDRAFAWIHVPGTPLFVGEIALVLGLWVIIQTPHLGRFIRLSRPIQLLLLFMMWGFALTFHGFGTWGIDAIRDGALWYYGFFALISGVLLIYKPEVWDQAIDGLTRFIPFFFMVMIIRLALAQTSFGPRIPDSRTRITAHKTGNIAVTVAIGLAFLILVIGPLASQKLRSGSRSITLLGLLLVLGAGTQSRAGFLAAFLILVVVFVVARHARGVMLGVAVVAVLLGILAAALDVKFQLDRRELSVEQVLENIQSVSEEATSGTRFDNTTQWRLGLWGEVVEDVFRKERVLTGFGFGENVAHRYVSGHSNAESVPLRNPHNSHLSVLARMGVVGVGLWLALFTSWYVTLIQARRQFRELGDDRRASLAFWLMLSMAAILTNALFDPTMEGPQVGILVWTLFGAGAVLGLGARSVGSRRRRRSKGEGDFDWLLLREKPSVEATDIAPLPLSEDLQQVVEGFDELLADGDEPEDE